MTKDLDPVGGYVLTRQLIADRMHQDLGVDVALEVVVPFAQEFVLEFLEVGQLAVEGDAVPLRLASMSTFERLGVTPIVASTGRVAHVADAGGALQARHDRLELRQVVQAERLGDGADLLVGLEQGAAIGVVCGHPGRELTPVLHVEQHARDESGHAVALTGDRRQLGDLGPIGVEDRRDAAFVMKFALHELAVPGATESKDAVSKRVRPPRGRHALSALEGHTNPSTTPRN